MIRLKDLIPILDWESGGWEIYANDFRHKLYCWKGHHTENGETYYSKPDNDFMEKFGDCEVFHMSTTWEEGVEIYIRVSE